MYKTKSKHHNFDLSKDVERIKQVLADTVYDVRGKATQAITESLDTMKDRSNTFQKSTLKFVNKKPLKTLGIVLISGLAIGFILRGRRTNSHTNSYWDRDKR